MTKKELEFLIEQGEGYNLEFKEGYNSSPAKEICAMANATGGRILIGVMDDGKIKPVVINNKIKSEIQDLVRNFDPGFTVDISEFAGVVIITVPEGKKKPYSTGGKFFMRQGANSQQLTRSEIRDFFIEEGLIAYDEKPNPNFNLAKDFNNKAFKKFLELAKIKTKLNKIDILKNLNLMFDNKRIKNAGVLLFGGDITRFIRSATITCATFQGNDKVKIIDRKEFDSDLLTNYESAFDYVSFRLNTEYIITKGPRIEKLEIPEEALREAILNAIAHRDYFFQCQYPDLCFLRSRGDCKSGRYS